MGSPVGSPVHVESLVHVGSPVHVESTVHVESPVHVGSPVFHQNIVTLDSDPCVFFVEFFRLCRE